MAELVKLCLAYLSYGLLICCMVSVGLLLQDNMSFGASVIYLVALLFVYYLCRKIALCHRDGTPVSQTLKGNLIVDVFLVIVFVQAYVDDLQEDKWYISALLACLWAGVDFLRCLLDMSWRDDVQAESHGETGRSVGKTFGNSSTFILRNYICSLVAWIALMFYFYMRRGFDGDFVIDMIWYFVVIETIISVCVLGTRISMGHESMVVYQHGNVTGKRDVRYAEIDNVVIDCSLWWGTRMTIYYGHGKQVVGYPAHADRIVDGLRRRHVHVECLV